MTALRTALTVSALFALLAPPVSSLSAEPQGELYWKVDGDSSGFYSLYDEDDPPTPYYGNYTYGAFHALDHACEQSTINGTYIDNKVRVVILLSTEVTGYCRVMTGGLFSYETDGSYYTAHLYCNGEQRDEGDTSPCPAPLVDPNNLGLPCEE